MEQTLRILNGLADQQLVETYAIDATLIGDILTRHGLLDRWNRLKNAQA